MLDGIIGGGIGTSPSNNTPPPSSTQPSSQTPPPNNNQPTSPEPTQPVSSASAENPSPEEIDDGTYSGTVPPQSNSGDDDTTVEQTKDEAATSGTAPSDTDTQDEEPVSETPQASQHAAPQPVQSQPGQSDLAQAEPGQAQSVGSQPSGTQPTGSHPSASHPVSSNPATSPSTPSQATPAPAEGSGVVDHVAAFLDQMRQIQDRYASVSLEEKEKTRQRAAVLMQSLLTSQMMDQMAGASQSFSTGSLLSSGDTESDTDSLAVQWYKQA